MFKTITETITHRGFEIEVTTTFCGDRIEGQLAVVIVSDTKKLSFTDIKTACSFASMLSIQNAA